MLVHRTIQNRIAELLFVWISALAFFDAPAGDLTKGGWQRSGLAIEQFVVNGTGGRHNPLRKAVNGNLFQDQIFVRFGLSYRSSGIDEPSDGNGEFFVLWFDAQEGGDDSAHANQIPNLGLHTDGKTNRFMIRYRSDQQVFSEPLKGDREYDLVGRLSKSKRGAEQPFDTLEMWIDPTVDQFEDPKVQVTVDKTINVVNWIGFSTGAKTEIDDEIVISDFRMGRYWGEIMDLPSMDAQSQRFAKQAIQTVSFQDDVLPILRTRCFECHAGSVTDSDIRLDQFDQVLNQVTPYDAANSHLYTVIAKSIMPPSGLSLSETEQKVIQSWINEGLDWDHQVLPDEKPTSDHWAFQPLRKPKIPQVTNREGLRNPIDAFITASQEALGVKSNPPATIEQIERRLYLDLHGLPVPKIIGEKQTAGLGSKIDELIDDPAYGVRWARHWLDVVRWAESNGYQHNRERKHAWRYRDWVVNAFYRGVDYKEFVSMQLAGDELSPYSDDALVATGYLAAARYSGNELDKEIQRNDIVNDITSNVGATFLGLTMQCAQCHHHKFDPISIRDYYQLQSFFVRGQPQNLLLASDDLLTELAAERKTLLDSVRQRVIRVRRRQNYPEPIQVRLQSVLSQMNPGEKARLKVIDSQLSGSDQTWGFFAPGSASRTLTVMPHEMRWPLSSDPQIVIGQKPRILIRGDVKTPGPAVNPDWPLIFRNRKEKESTSIKTRTEFAQWLTSAENPLVARVWVNRLWQWHFGRGLVESANDFGVQGSIPTHPELLDYLATQLIEWDWDTNRIQRLILDSATFRTSSQMNDSHHQLDPENLTYWRWEPRRLEAEVIRDSMLSLAGRLDETMGGPSSESDSKRRSLYLQQKRDELPYQQDLFDGPNGVVSCARRQVSTNALQPLWLLNNSFVHEMASAFALRAKTVNRAFRMALNRDPTPQENQLLTKLEMEHSLASVCLVLFNSSEFLYMP